MLCCDCIVPGHVNTTLCALSSVARLSVSMTMLMSSGIYRSPSYQDRCRAICLRRPASMIVPPRSGSARALKRRTVSGGETARGPSRIESMPNMRSGATGVRRPAERRERTAAIETGARSKYSTVDSSRKPRIKSSAVRYVATTKGEEVGDGRATPPPTTSGSSSVVVDIEATSTSSAVVPPLTSQPESPSDVTLVDGTFIQSPVNSSGVRIVIDSNNDDVDRDHIHLPDGPETTVTCCSASTTSGSGDDDEDSSNVVLFHCGPSDDDVELTSGCRSPMISGVAEPLARDKQSGDAGGLHLLSDNVI